MTATLESDQVSPEQLARYSDLIYDRTGIRISPQKRTLLSNRVRRRLRSTGIANFDAYFAHLKRLPAVDPEWDAFLQEITTHETYLFRDPTQWNWFRNEYLPEMMGQVRRGEHPKSLRIWSAAASTGDEAFTIACCLAERIPSPAEWRLEIIGTDIGVGALEQARAATFGERAMRQVPADLKRRFFTSVPGERWQAKPLLTNMTAFRQHNLLEPLKTPSFDVIFLKNVLIYFDGDSKRIVMEHLIRALRPGGLLVSGPAEGIGDLLQGFDRLQTWLHRRR